MSPQIVNRWTCDRCPNQAETSGSYRETDPSPPTGWRRVLIDGVAWLLCSECVATFHEWMKQQTRLGVEP